MTEPDERRARMIETVRLVITRRERAARSPAMDRAIKRLIWRYSRTLHSSGRDVHDSNRDTEGFDQR